MAAITGAIAGLVGTGFSIAQGIDQAEQAAKQRRREAALQNKARTQEEVAGRKEKAKKKALDLQRQREAAIGTSEQGKIGSGQSNRQGSSLGQSPSGMGRSLLGG